MPCLKEQGCISEAMAWRCSLCGGWYHKECQNISELVFKKKTACVCKSVVRIRTVL